MSKNCNIDESHLSVTPTTDTLSSPISSAIACVTGSSGLGGGPPPKKYVELNCLFLNMFVYEHLHLQRVIKI